MRFMAAVYGELIKVRHTAFGVIHVLLPLLGAVLFVAYYLLYRDEDAYRKLNLILEITATIFPILISIAVGMNLSTEERNNNFGAMLAVPNRGMILAAKLSVLYGAGFLALLGLYCFFLTGVGLLGVEEGIPIGELVWSVLGLALGNAVICVFHVFLHLKWGLGVSLFWGVFECLQCILYSNIELVGGWRYIPFSWSVNWVHDSLRGRFTEHGYEWMVIAGLLLAACTGLPVWFARWEGRRTCE